MLHKGKLQAALNFKRGQFTAYDDSFSEQLRAYRHALETLYQTYPSGIQLEQMLPSDGPGTQPAGARPSIEFDRWLVNAPYSTYHGPLFPFGREFANHEQAHQWAECIEGVTTLAVDGSQLQPWRCLDPRGAHSSGPLRQSPCPGASLHQRRAHRSPLAG